MHYNTSLKYKRLVKIVSINAANKKRCNRHYKIGNKKQQNKQLNALNNNSPLRIVTNNQINCLKSLQVTVNNGCINKCLCVKYVCPILKLWIIISSHQATRHKHNQISKEHGNDKTWANSHNPIPNRCGLQVVIR